ncbi:MAG TPA: hypothetical protein VME66_02590 [Candidatus Acidoferrales bacterium]|nr:hypothetical protein [Candidatus Acidoferrales bacterium]
MLRRLVLVFALALPLFGADTAVAPVVVVYPYSTTSGVAEDAGGKIAVVIATQLSQFGDLDILPATPGTDRTQFLTAAQAQNADYYVTGYLTPLGDEVSLVSQVVSVATGILVWSNTEEVTTYGQAVGQADAIHQAILEHAGRAFASIDEPPPSTSAPRNQEQGNLVQAFAHHGSHQSSVRVAAAPAPTASARSTPASVAAAAVEPRKQRRSRARPAAVAVATPTPAAVVALAPSAPLPTWTAAAKGSAILVAIGGDAPSAQRLYASAVLANALNRAGLHTTVAANMSSDDMPDRASRACERATGTDIYTGTLSVQFAGGRSRHSTDATFDLVRYNCNGDVLASAQSEALASGQNDVDSAIGRAIAGALPPVVNPPRRPR